jgi:hypothetical protein
MGYGFVGLGSSLIALGWMSKRTQKLDSTHLDFAALWSGVGRENSIVFLVSEFAGRIV